VTPILFFDFAIKEQAMEDKKLAPEGTLEAAVLFIVVISFQPLWEPL
jgi:hypothetical protein